MLGGCYYLGETLDTSKLKEVKPKNEVVQHAPLTYEAPSVPAGLEAVPFTVNLPVDLPFEAVPFQRPIIYDLTREGKEVKMSVSTFSRNKEDQVRLEVIACNREEEFEKQKTNKVTLIDGTVAYYQKDRILFEKDGIFYEVIYTNHQLSRNEHQAEIVKIASQML